ncbi:MAG: hypothetical protein ABIP21_06280 [Acidimicrobiia bacterium]
MRRHSSRLRRLARVGAIVVAVIAVGACRQAIVTYPSTDPRPAETTLLTPDGTDAYNFASSTGQMQVAALDTNTSANLRSALWPADSPLVADAQSCATWASQSIALAQQGAALRIATANGSTRAITVTKNIVFGATWIFNVHTWDTAAVPAFQPVGSISLESELWPNDVESPLPWHVCVRTVGTTLDLKVWRADEPEPAWGETGHGGSVTLPETAVYPGATGWYIGHLSVGAHAEFSDLRTWKLVVGPAATAPAAALVATSSATPGAVTVTGGLPPR